ncbi:MAG: hypothetical protein ACK4PR_00675 [Gammaproteobacteria bacterium]
MKAWIFAEGYCEVQLMTWLVIHYFPSVIITKDLSDFLTADKKYVCYIESCDSVDRIPHSINEQSYKINKNKLDSILVVCDVEDLKCPTFRKNKILDKLTSEVNKDKLKFIFSIPMIEEIYCSEPVLAGTVAGKLCNASQKLIDTHISSLTSGKGSPKERMKKLFRNLNGNYRETIFSEKFFSQLKYIHSNNKTIKRLIKIWDEIFPEAKH